MKDLNTPEELLDFMKNNFNYGYLGKNGKTHAYNDHNFKSDWLEQYVLESKDDILKTLYGTCWDEVEFERDWFESRGYEIKTFYEMVYLDYTNPYPTHSFLVFKDNDKWYWFEHSFRDNLGIHRFDTINELLKYEYGKYLESLREYNISREEIERIVFLGNINSEG